MRLTWLDEIKESQPLKFLAMKSRGSSNDFNGRSSAFGGSRLVLFGSQDGDSTIVTFPFPEENLDAFCNGYFQLVKSRDNSLYIILVRVIDHSLRKIF